MERILLEQKKTTVENLAFELQVSTRTIHRDIVVLSFRLPIYTVQGRGGGVFVDAMSVRKNRQLTKTELRVLYEAKELLSEDRQKIILTMIRRLKD